MMSGGSYDYLCYRIEDTYVGRMYDLEFDEMMRDLGILLKSLEWWRSGDTSEDSYRKQAMEFKEKWFKGDRQERLMQIIDLEVDKLKLKLSSTFLGTESEEY